MDLLSTRLSRRSAFGAAALALGGLAAGCASTAAQPASSGAPRAAGPVVNVGYFPNVTHAPGLIADHRGFLPARLAAAGSTASTKSFNAGPDVIQAILGGSLDISYIGPNPTVTAYIQSRGVGIRVIGGSTSGGASLVVRPGITSPEQLRGTRLATPQLGNTQDVALRYWLSTQGLTATKDGGGDVSILPQKNSTAVQAFATGAIDGGWLPEPFATALVRAGGAVLLDERSLWPEGRFVTTNIIARTAFLEERPQVVRAFLDAHLDALDAIAEDAAAAQAAVAEQIERITSQGIEAAVLDAAWSNIEFTADPLADTLRKSAEHADSIGLLPEKSSDGFARLWDVTLLNEALTARNLPKVATA